MDRFNSNNLQGIIAKGTTVVDSSTDDFTITGSRECFVIKVLVAGTVRVITEEYMDEGTEQTITFADSDVGNIYPLAIRTIISQANNAATQETSYTILY